MLRSLRYVIVALVMGLAGVALSGTAAGATSDPVGCGGERWRYSTDDEFGALTNFCWHTTSDGKFFLAISYRCSEDVTLGIWRAASCLPGQKGKPKVGTAELLSGDGSTVISRQAIGENTAYKASQGRSQTFAETEPIKCPASSGEYQAKLDIIFMKSVGLKLREAYVARRFTFTISC